MYGVLDEDKSKPISHPESIHKPKEFLGRLSRDTKGKSRYSHAVHNEKVAQHLNLDQVRKKCPSFQPLVDLVTLGIGNYPKKFKVLIGGGLLANEPPTASVTFPIDALKNEAYLTPAYIPY